ncbi:sugar phosphate isomerase/epimerase [bacterium]|nr:sugar phosphate isomerase/epimerase [bacterium]
MVLRKSLTLPALLFCLSACVQLHAADPLYQQDFNETEPGETPNDFLVLGGRFGVKQSCLELPGTPLDNHGAVFGPDNEGDIEISARIRSERKGRLYPSFGIGLFGLGGYSLKVSPAKKNIELYRGRTMVSEAPFDWKSGHWTHLRLEIKSAEADTWSLRGKAWVENTTEPLTWQISSTTSIAPTQGKASLWGQPFSGKAIQYDDLLIKRPETAFVKSNTTFELGLQTWTLRNLDFEQTVAFAKEHGIRMLQLISKHLNPHADWPELEAKKAILDANGLTAYTFGVAGTSLEHAYNRRLFEFAKFMGIKVIIVEPRDFKIFDSLEKLVQEFDIRIAIHNHGLTSLYGNPLVVRSILKHRDPRIGVCLDVGWITAAGFDAAKVYRRYEGRVYDIHLKDKTVEISGKGLVGISASIGKGDANIKGLIQELETSAFKGVLAIETDSPIFARQPSEFVKGAKSYFLDLLPR